MYDLTVCICMSQRATGDLVGGEPASAGTTQPRADGGEFTVEAVHGILGNQRRRYVLEFLREHGDTVGMRELCVAVAARENDCEPDDVRPKQRKRVYTALRQTHLPRLATAGLVEYDRDRSTVTPTDRLSVLDPYFGTEGKRPQWPRYYTALGAVGLLLALAGGLGLPVVGAVPDGLLAALLALAVLATAAVHRSTEAEPAGPGSPLPGTEDGD